MKTAIIQVSLFALGAMAVLAATAQAQGAAGSWTGSYVALSAGSSRVSDARGGLTFDTNADGAYGDTVQTFTGANYFSPGFCRGTALGQTPAAGCEKDRHKGGIGIRAGYDWQTGRWVYGAVVDVSSLKLHDSVSAFSSAPDAYTFSRDLKTLTAVRGRIGWGEHKWLVYATAGFASADIDRAFATTNALNSFTALHTNTANGGQLGAGAEWRFSRNWTVGVEYLNTSLRDHGPVVLAQGSANTFASNAFLTQSPEGTAMRRSDGRFRFDTVSVTVTYRFGAM